MTNEPATPKDRKLHQTFLNVKKLLAHLEDLIDRDEDEEHAEWERLRSYADYEPLPFDATAAEDKPACKLCGDAGERYVEVVRQYGNINAHGEEIVPCECQRGKRCRE
jgi:hypothetical protein